MSWIVPLLSLFLAVGLLLGAGRAPAVSLTIEDDALQIHLGFWDRIYCVHQDLVIPLEQIEGVAVAGLADVPRTGMRLPGTSLPGVVRAGSYGTGVQRDFWDIRRADTVLVIQLVFGAPYRRIVLQVPDPHATALALGPAMGTYTGTFT